MIDPQRKYRLAREPGLARKLLAVNQGERILEAGCGYGRLTQHLLEAGAHVTACDASPKMVEYCEQRFSGLPGFECVQTDIGDLPFHDKCFDKVLCSGVLMHVDDKVRVIDELARVVRMGGTLVISVNSTFSPFIQTMKLSDWVERYLRRLLHKAPRERDTKFEQCAPSQVTRQLRQIGLRVTAVEADTLLCADYRVPQLWRPVMPTIGLPAYKAVDRLLARHRPFSYFGWEVWFAATR